MAGVAGGFSAVQGGMALLGVESESTQEAILKVQSAMALSEGAQAVGESVDSFRQLGAVIKSTTAFQKISTAAQTLWNLAMSANPIGAVVLAITALIAAGAALVSWYKSSSDEAKKNSQAVKSNSQALESQKKTADKTADSIKKNSDYQLEMAKASGASAESIRKLELKLVDEKIAYANSSREVAKNTYYKNLNALASLKAAGADEEVIKAQAEITKKSLEEFGKQTKNLNDANTEKVQIIRKHNVEKKQAQTNHNKEVTDANKKSTDEGKQNAIDQAKEDLDNLNNALKAQKDAEISAQNELTQAIGEAQDKQAQKGMSATDIEIQNIQDKYFRLNELAIQQGRSEEERAILQTQKQNEIDAQKKIKADADAVTKKAEDEKKLADAKAQAEKELAINIALEQAKRNALNTGLDLLQQFAGKNKAVALGILAVQKGLAISDVIVGATKAIGLAKASMAPTPLNPAFLGPGVPNPSYLANLKLGAASILTTKITAATSIASILAAGISGAKSITAGGSGGGGASDSGGGGGSASQPPAFNVVGTSSTNQLAQTIAGQQQQPIKTYVVANDVSTAQSLERNIIQSATIG